MRKSRPLDFQDFDQTLFLEVVLFVNEYYVTQLPSLQEEIIGEMSFDVFIELFYNAPFAFSSKYLLIVLIDKLSGNVRTV